MVELRCTHHFQNPKGGCSEALPAAPYIGLFPIMSKGLFCMLLKCEKHGTVSCCQVCIHFCNALSSGKNVNELHVIKCYLKNTIRGEDYVGDVFLCNACASLLSFKAEIIYDYQLLLENEKKLFAKIKKFFCCECIDESLSVN